MPISAYSDLSGLALLLDAAGLADGALASWSDGSGNARHATQATAGKRPVVASGVVTFDGNGQEMATPSFATTDEFTLAAVVRIDSATATINQSGFVCADTGGANRCWRFRYSLGGGNLQVYENLVGVDTVYEDIEPQVDKLEWAVVTARVNASAIYVQVNGMGAYASDRPAALRTASTPRRVGRPNSSTVDANTLLGSVALLLEYNRALSDAELFDLVELIGTQKGVAVHYQPDLEESMAPIRALDVRNNWGLHLRGDTQWEVEAAAQAGAKWCRWQAGWNDVEPYATAPGGFTTAGTIYLEKALAYCATYGLKPLVVCGYAPAYQSQSLVAVAADAPAGATSFTVVQDVTALAALVPRLHIIKQSGGHLTDPTYRSYYGSYVHSIDAGTKTITLSAPLSASLAAGTILTPNALKYAPIPVNDDPDDASVAAFVAYVEHVMARIAAVCGAGSVEIWNEPSWAADSWDWRGRYYPTGTTPAGVSTQSGLWAILGRLLRDVTPPAGVDIINSLPHKSGFNALFGDANPLRALATQEAVERTGMADAFHPYNNVPEGKGWWPTLVAQAPSRSGLEPNVHLEGADPSANFSTARWFNAQWQLLNGYSVPQIITEIGEATPGGEEFKATQTLRVLLYYMAAGLERIIWYTLADVPGTTAWVVRATRVPNDVYYAVQDFMADLNQFTEEPLPYTAADMPKLVAYDGEYPAMTVPVVGRRAGGTANVLLHCCWQRSFVNPYNTDGSALWSNQARPAEAEITVRLPSGYAGAVCRNLVTRNSVRVTMNEDGGLWYASYPITDQPVMLRVTETVETPTEHPGIAMWRRGAL